MLLLLGVPLRAAMEAMGWSEASMAKRYQHITSELLAGIADQVGGHYRSDSDPDDGRRTTAERRRRRSLSSKTAG
jgi:hypothetical protein